MEKYSTLKERFLRYVKFNTRSDEKSETIPSTPSQMEFAKMLKEELEDLIVRGNENAERFIYENGFEYITLKTIIEIKSKKLFKVRKEF